MSYKIGDIVEIKKANQVACEALFIGSPLNLDEEFGEVVDVSRNFVDVLVASSSYSYCLSKGQIGRVLEEAPLPR